MLISLFLGLGKIWTSLGLKWLKEIAVNDFGCCLSATSATALVFGRCSARPCFWGGVVLLVVLQRPLRSAVALHCSQKGVFGLLLRDFDLGFEAQLHHFVLGI